jgi:hypothetical protein
MRRRLIMLYILAGPTVKLVYSEAVLRDALFTAKRCSRKFTVYLILEGNHPRMYEHGERVRAIAKKR